MNYRMTTPCDECPWRRDTNFTLPRERMSEFVGEVFACHKTYTKGQDVSKQSHCAGSFIFHEQNNIPHQGMLLGQYLELYDPDKLDLDADVYKSLEDMPSKRQSEG